MDTVKTYTNGLNLWSVTQKNVSLFFVSVAVLLSLSRSLSAHYGTRSLHCLPQITWSMKLEPHTVWSEARLHLSTVRTLCQRIPTVCILQCHQTNLSLSIMPDLWSSQIWNIKSNAAVVWGTSTCKRVLCDMDILQCPQKYVWILLCQSPRKSLSINNTRFMKFANMKY